MISVISLPPSPVPSSPDTSATCGGAQPIPIQSQTRRTKKSVSSRITLALSSPNHPPSSPLVPGAARHSPWKTEPAVLLAQNSSLRDRVPSGSNPAPRPPHAPRRVPTRGSLHRRSPATRIFAHPRRDPRDRSEFIPRKTREQQSIPKSKTTTRLPPRTLRSRSSASTPTAKSRSSPARLHRPRERPCVRRNRKTAKRYESKKLKN